MRSRLIHTLLGICLSLLLYGQNKLLTNIYNREHISLNGEWHYIIDPYENGYYNYRYEAFDQQESPNKGAFFTNSKPEDKTDLIEYDFDQMKTLSVPGDWNTQEEQLLYYEGTVWYKKSFDYTKAEEGNKVFLYFGAINYKAEVYLNGQKLGVHVGGFTPFCYEVTEVIKPKENFIVVKVDNKRTNEGVPTLNTDWWNYGGITRDVRLVETPPTYISNYSLRIPNGKTDDISLYLQLKGSNAQRAKIKVSIPDLNVHKILETDKNGQLQMLIPVQNIQRWAPSSPKLYHTELSCGNDIIIDSIGFRTIETKGPEILLNGEAIFLKGISIHEESPISKGRANTVKDAEQLLGYAKSLGCNFVRLAHYPHNEHMIRVADKLGLLVWEEIPVYWTISWENPATFLNAREQLTSLIQRDINRASVIIWSIANETPVNTARNGFLTGLAHHARTLDNTRLISAALEISSTKEDPNTRIIDDPFAKQADVLSFNQYIGWYDGAVEKCREINWNITQDKPVIISEFGAGAKFGHHGDKKERWTEEYQEYLYQETLKMIEEIDQLRGVSPWILVDFRSPRRVLPEIQDTYNRKGLISENGEKKKAFYVLKEYYDSK